MNFKKWVKNIQTVGYNGARTVYINFPLHKKSVKLRHDASKQGILKLTTLQYIYVNHLAQAF